jgi:hypothetical protein
MHLSVASSESNKQGYKEHVLIHSYCEERYLKYTFSCMFFGFCRFYIYGFYVINDSHNVTGIYNNLFFFLLTYRVCLT